MLDAGRLNFQVLVGTTRVINDTTATLENRITSALGPFAEERHVFDDSGRCLFIAGRPSSAGCAVQKANMARCI